MKDLHLLVWLTQLGLSTAAPAVGFILLALWLRNQFGWGDWVLVLGIIFGVVSAVNGLYTSLKTLNRINRNKSDKDEPPVSFNEHD
jgi:hypothetical protein